MQPSAETAPSTDSTAKKSLATWALALAILVGMVFRLIWANDMEYKGDEIYMYDRAHNVGVTEAWPWLGMPSGVGTLNPGMSIWVFVIIGKIFGTSDPVTLVRGAMILNCLALMLLGWIAYRWNNTENKIERETWMWGAAIAALNPLAVLLERKLWASTTFPLISTIALIAYLKRDRKSAAFIWGLLGACLGQIHMPGFFFSLALVIWAIAFDPQRKKTKWGYYFGGSVLGALPLIPWLEYMHKDPSSKPGFPGLFSMKYWGHWLSDAAGTGLRYSLGEHFEDFLRFPMIGDTPTYLMGMLHLLATGVGAAILLGATYTFFKKRYGKFNELLGRSSSLGLVLSASFFGFGLLMTLAGVRVHRHYLLVAFPLEFLWLARLGLYQRSMRFGRAALLAMCVMQAAISATFLYYIHVRGGAPNADYGVAYSHQNRTN